MMLLKFPFISLLFVFISLQGHGQNINNQHNKLFGIFDGRTPCNVLSIYLNEPPRPECFKIKWRLTLFVDSISGKPTSYELIGLTYKKEKPRAGNWQILEGTYTDAKAIVLQLSETGRPPLLLQKGDDNILFFLDKDRKLLVGNKDFSYTLNRKPGS
jgi:hypothetical protein